MIYGSESGLAQQVFVWRHSEHLAPRWDRNSEPLSPFSANAGAAGFRLAPARSFGATFGAKSSFGSIWRQSHIIWRQEPYNLAPPPFFFRDFFFGEAASAGCEDVRLPGVSYSGRIALAPPGRIFAANSSSGGVGAATGDAGGGGADWRF